MVSAQKPLDSKVQAKGVNHERGARKKCYPDKLKEQEDQCRRGLSCAKARLEREIEARLLIMELTHKQSVVTDDVKAEIRQTSSEATEAMAHLAEDTIGSITYTGTCNVRAELHNIVRENLPANGGGE